MKPFFVLLGIASFVFGAVGFPSASAGPLEDQFFQMDKSRDGAISRSEYTEFQIANGVTERRANFAFENLKGDDNLVSLNEYRAGPAARQRPQRLQRSSRSNARNDRRRPAPRRSTPRGGSFGGGGGS